MKDKILAIIRTSSINRTVFKLCYNKRIRSYRRSGWIYPYDTSIEVIREYWDRNEWIETNSSRDNTDIIFPNEINTLLKAIEKRAKEVENHHAV